MPRCTPPRLLILCPGTSGQQAAPVADALALWQALRAASPAPALVAGLGAGELAAHAIAGALTAADALRLAHLRAELMHDCLVTYPGQAMLAIGALPLALTAQLIAGDLYTIAIEQNDTTCIAAGPLAGLPAVTAVIHAAGGHSQQLAGSLAAHSNYMAPAVPRFAAALRHTAFGRYRLSVLSALDGSSIASKASAVEHLSRQLAEPVRWRACMDRCAAAGITAALELQAAPDATLAAQLQARHPAIDSRAAADFGHTDGLLDWLAALR